MSDLLEIKGLFPSIVKEGFSAYKASLSTSGTARVTTWVVSPPAFSSSNFADTTGYYTVPITGLYAMQATIGYETDAAISVQLGAGINPFFVIRKSSPTTADLISGPLPVFNTGLALLTLRTLLGSSTVTLSGVVELTEGDILALYYDANTLSLDLTLQDIWWSVYRLE